jgi:hypothetical protein
MRAALCGTLLLMLAACSGPVDVPVPSPPATTTTRVLTEVPVVADPVDVAPLMVDDPCVLISRERLAELRVVGQGEPFEYEGSRGCLWVDTRTTSRLWTIVEPNRNPVAANYMRPGVELIDVTGFPALRLGVKPDVLCQVWLAAGEEQGISVTYGPVRLNPDSCIGAVAVAGDLGARLRR